MFNRHPLPINALIMGLLFRTQLVALPFFNPFPFVSHHNLPTFVVVAEALKT